MGYMGLKTFSDSDNAADINFKISKLDKAKSFQASIGKILRKESRRRDNGYNTDGWINVALNVEALNPKMFYCVNDNEEIVIALMQSIEIGERELAKYSNELDTMHKKAYVRMIKNMKKFLQQIRKR